MKSEHEQAIIKHIEELLGVNKVVAVKEFSRSIKCKEYNQIYREGDTIRVEPVNDIETPFYRINKTCIAYGNDKVSLVSYKSFAIIDEDISFIKEEVDYIFQDMDKHIFTNGSEYRGHYVRELDVFLKENKLYGITYLDNKTHEMDIKGKLIDDPSIKNISLIIKDCTVYDGTYLTITPEMIHTTRTLLSIEGNVLYENNILTGAKDKDGVYREYINHVSLGTTTLHKDEKEIEDVEVVDVKYKNDGWITDAPDFYLALIIKFVDGTKRLLVKTEEGKKVTSRYFKNLKLDTSYISLTKEEVEKEYPEDIDNWDNECGYCITGLTFDCSTDYSEGELTINNDGHIKSKLKRI